MTLEELIPAWRKWCKSNGGLVRIRKSVLQKTNLPDETKQFLNQVGLPEMINYGRIKLTLPHLTELVSETGPLPDSSAYYRVLAEVGYRMFQCLDEENGQVVVVIADPEREKTVHFFHSSIRHFAECCVSTGEVWDVEVEQGYAGFPSPEWDEFIAKYEQTIREIDPLALADESTWCARELRNLRAGIW